MTNTTRTDITIVDARCSRMISIRAINTLQFTVPATNKYMNEWHTQPSLSATDSMQLNITRYCNECQLKDSTGKILIIFIVTTSLAVITQWKKFVKLITYTTTKP